MKLELWEQKVGQGRRDIFENLSSAVTSQNVTRNQEIVQEQLSSLKKEFLSYFPDLSLLDAKLIRSPFTVDASSVPDDIQDEFGDLINDSTAKKSLWDSFPSQVLVENGWILSSCFYSCCEVLASVSRDSHPCALSRPNIAPDWL